jgi:hypothetical protein
VDSELYQITATQFAVDGKIEERKVSDAISDL